MVEQICEKCGTRYSLYAPVCPSCGQASPQPAKKPGCPQAPAPAPKQKPASAQKQDKSTDASTTTPEKVTTKPEVSVTVETEQDCPCKHLALPFALIGIAAAVFGIFKLIRK